MSYGNKRCQVLGHDEEMARLFEERAKADGIEVTGRRVWTGPVPERGSYMAVGDGVIMSTPEFYFLRKANELDELDAIMLGFEMCGHYQTSLSCYDIPEGDVEMRDEPQTTTSDLLEYLWQVRDTPEGERAISILSEVVDGVETPLIAMLIYMSKNI